MGHPAPGEALPHYHRFFSEQFTRWAAMGQKGCRFSLFLFSPVQANLALSPTALLPSPKTSEVKLQPAPLSPTTPCTPLSPPSPLSPTLRPSQLCSEEEDLVSFENPPEGTPLPSINKTRARLSFKRRLPTRQHRRSAAEEAGAFASTLSPSELYSPKENGDHDQVFDSPAEEAECGQPAGVKEAEEKNRDCEKTEDGVAKSDPDSRRDPEEEQEAEQAQGLDTLEEERQPSEPCLAKQIQGNIKTEEEQEEMAQEEHQGGNDRV
ncbi:uncharacterized protein LOC143322853 isoform X1 [Chaetodon auriga]|uniref:uncharacterized protein LOC143322853 isoform X1 n=1 Tax=Chaetodon auriga TaxID=39042 RepID=UPI004032BE15